MMKLLPDKKVRERYGVCAMTLRRWDADEKLGFPKPIIIRSRKYRREDELNEFNSRMAVSPREAKR